MQRATISALVKLAVSLFILVALIAVWHLNSGGAISAVAAVLTVVVAGPTFLLVAIDTGRALSSTAHDPVVSTALRLPQIALGVIAFAGGIGGLALIFSQGVSAPPYVISCSIVSVGLLLYGRSLLRELWTRK